MTEIRRLDPHDPLPDGPGRHVSVLHRFDEDDPCRTVTEITLALAPGRGESTQPMNPDGTPMSIEQALAAAEAVAQSEGIDVVYLIDRTAGLREHEILAHGGDHTIAMDTLDDTDMEEGERGSDMRDRVV